MRAYGRPLALPRGLLLLSALAPAALALFPSAALADAPASVGVSGAASRAATLQDTTRNSTAASFGSPTTDDRRLFSLRWRLPFLVVSNTELSGGSAFLRNFSSSATPLPGVGFAVEPMEDFSPLIPQLRLFEPRKPFHMQAGVLSADIGHGSIVSGFTNAPEGAIRRAGLLLEGNLSGLGGQAMVGDLFEPQSFLAGRVYGRPIMWFTAPDATFQPNELDLDPRTEVTGIWVTGLSFAVDAAAPLHPDSFETTPIFAGGWDNEAALLDNQLIKLIGYLDLNVLAGQRTGHGVGVGAHPGLITMFDVLGVRFDVSAEYGIGTDSYVPRYFDRTYYLERSRLFGTEYTKVAADAPASHGYNLRVKAGLLEALTLFAEAQDQLPFDTTRGTNSARVTVGASGFFLFLGGHVAVTQAGIREYLNPGFFDTGFMATAEGRVALVANIFHLVARAWRVHDELPRPNGPLKYVDQGAMVGLEVNLDML